MKDQGEFDFDTAADATTSLGLAAEKVVASLVKGRSAVALDAKSLGREGAEFKSPHRPAKWGRPFKCGPQSKGHSRTKPFQRQ